MPHQAIPLVSNPYGLYLLICPAKQFRLSQTHTFFYLPLCMTSVHAFASHSGSLWYPSALGPLPLGRYVMCLDDCGWTPLHHAVFAMQEESAAALLSYNANLICRCGAGALMQA